MSIVTIDVEVSALNTAVKRAKQKAEQLMFVHDAEFDAVASAAISAALSDPADSTAILGAAETKFSRYANADHTMIRKARATAGALSDSITAQNAPAAAAASASAIADATTKARAPVEALAAAAAAINASRAATLAAADQAGTAAAAAATATATAAGESAEVITQAGAAAFTAARNAFGDRLDVFTPATAFGVIHAPEIMAAAEAAAHPDRLAKVGADAAASVLRVPMMAAHEALLAV